MQCELTQETVAVVKMGLEGLLRQCSRSEAFRVGVQIAQLRQHGTDPFPTGTRLHALAAACVQYSRDADEKNWALVRQEKAKVRVKRGLPT